MRPTCPRKTAGPAATRPATYRRLGRWRRPRRQHHNAGKWWSSWHRQPWPLLPIEWENLRAPDLFTGRAFLNGECLALFDKKSNQQKVRGRPGRCGVVPVGRRASGRREALFLWRSCSSPPSSTQARHLPRSVPPWTGTEQSTMCRPGTATPDKLHARREDHCHTPCPADRAHRQRRQPRGRTITQPPGHYRTPSSLLPPNTGSIPCSSRQ